VTGITTYLSILTLNVNGIDFSIKRHHLENWIKRENPTICVYRKPFSLSEANTGLG
jgi:hypothetical protein